jgi:hypothetical protein
VPVLSRRAAGLWLGCVAAALAGCGADEGTPDDADVGFADVGSTDAGLADAGAADAGRVDAGAADAGRVDGGTADAGRVDAGAAGRVDGGTADAGRVDGGAADAGAAPGGPVLYPAARTQSPMTDAVVAGLRAVAARRRRDDAVVAKVGASNTVNSNFLHCFAGTNVDLGGRDALRATLDFYRAGRVMGASAFSRTSLAATVGWSAWSALQGAPSPLQREVDASDARVAVVMFGTNDIQSQNWHRYGQNLWDIADTLSAQGVVTVMTSIPPRDDSATADGWVPRYVAIMRAVAQSRQLPFVDLERQLRALPDHGLGSDGIHMNALPSGARACAFTPTGLRYGFNQRNLLTLEALHRVRQALGGAAPDVDTAALHLTGAGTAASPFVVPALPFSDARDTRAGGERRVDRYPGCNSAADESGPEFVYALTVTEPTPVYAMVIVRGTTDIDLHHLRGATVDGAACAARDDRVLSLTLSPGTHRFVLDTYAVNGAPRAGEYLFVLVRGGA